MPTALVALLDALVILAFAALGRASHSEGFGGTIAVAAPFLIAAGVGWLVQRQRWSWALSRSFAAVVWAVTLALGMLLRHTVFDRGTAIDFIIVAALFLLLLLGGWRELARWRVRARAAAPVAHD